MPLPDDRCLIRGLLQKLGECDLRTIEDAGRIINEAIEVSVFAREDGGTAGATNRVRHQAAVEAHSFFGDSVNIGSRIPVRTVGAHRLPSVVVGKDEDNVRLLRFFFCR